jgi:hypothetical protein
MLWPGPAKLLSPQGNSGHRASAGVEFAEAHRFSYPHPVLDNVTLVTGCWLVSDSAREGPQDRHVNIARAPLPAALVGRREPDPGLPERLRKA